MAYVYSRRFDGGPVRAEVPMAVRNTNYPVGAFGPVPAPPAAPPASAAPAASVLGQQQGQQQPQFLGPPVPASAANQAASTFYRDPRGGWVMNVPPSSQRAPVAPPAAVPPVAPAQNAQVGPFGAPGAAAPPWGDLLQTWMDRIGGMQQLPAPGQGWRGMGDGNDPRAMFMRMLRQWMMNGGPGGS